MMLWTRWAAGPEARPAGEVFVSVTQFQAGRMRDLPGIIWSGLRLKGRLGELPGAVGTWLWVDFPTRRVGSVSLWRAEADMRHFVRWEPHAEIVKRYRQAGQVRATSWTTAERNSSIIRAEAAAWLVTAGAKHAHS